MKKVLSEKDLIFIKENYLKISAREIGDTIGKVSKGTITSAIKKLGLSIPIEKKLEFKNKALRKWRSSIVHPLDNTIKELYLQLPVKTLADKLGVNDGYLRRRLNKLGLIIPDYLIQQRKINSRIKKGTIPPNKGLKQLEYMSAEAIEKTKATRFKKGQLPHNAIGFKDGDITTRYDKLKDGSTRPYKWYRISKAKWKMLHVHIWEQQHGPVPAGMIIVFKDKNSLNCMIENLEMISLAQNIQRNTIHRFPPELKQTIRIIKKISKTINKKQNGNEQPTRRQRANK